MIHAAEESTPLPSLRSGRNGLLMRLSPLHPIDWVISMRDKGAMTFLRKLVAAMRASRRDAKSAGRRISPGDRREVSRLHARADGGTPPRHPARRRAHRRRALPRSSYPLSRADGDRRSRPTRSSSASRRAATSCATSRDAATFPARGANAARTAARPPSSSATRGAARGPASRARASISSTASRARAHRPRAT